ncbi:MAG: sensor histidine kinase [Cyanobacteria bacterium J06632_3]
MNTAVFVSPSIQKILRWVEWFLIAHCLLDTLTSVGFEHSWTSYLQLGIFIVTVGTLSLFFPVSKPLWQRRIYILLEMLPLIVFITFPINDFLFFELFMLKACFLLPRRDVVITVVTTVSLFVAQIIWQLPALIERSKVNSVSYFNQPNQIIFDILVEYVVGCTFVLLMGIVFAAEQRSRHKAEVLAQEVESLATNLERTRIARDIHDSLGHSLTTLDVQLALAERYSQAVFDWQSAQSGSPDQAFPDCSSQQAPTDQQRDQQSNTTKINQLKLQQSLKAAQQLVSQCLTEARQSLHTMRESSFSLPNALETLAAQMRQFFVVKLRVELPQQLPQQLSYQLYLMVKEGLSNAQKHADCSQVSLSVVANAQSVNITLVDDGCGFDTTARTTGYGLQGLRERSQLIGGTVTINSQPSEGTTLQVIVPLNVPVFTPASKQHGHLIPGLIR